MKKILILGAGMVARPIVRFFLDKKIHITLGDVVRQKAEEMIQGHPCGVSVSFNVENKELLDTLVSEHDVVVSLLPWIYHPQIAEVCIKHRKHLVTSSYVKESMQRLNDEAKRAGILLLNELGLDPGIDHMSAKRIIDKVHADGGKILGFYSLCGALPAPESADNPFRYKFSWSPKGVILAGNSDARYLKNGKHIYIPTEKLFLDSFPFSFPPVGKFEVYPNRDSEQYIDLYAIPETQTMYRGTIRYNGWCNVLHAIKKLGYTQDKTDTFHGLTYADITAKLVGHDNIENLHSAVAKFLNVDNFSAEMDALQWLGLLDNIPACCEESTYCDILSNLMTKKMKLNDDDYDMCIMQHQFLIGTKEGKRELIKSSLLDYGSPKSDTSIARTVALPAAAGALLLLENKINLTGVQIPILPEIYNPILQLLEEMNISMKEEFGLSDAEFIGKKHFPVI